MVTKKGLFLLYREKLIFRYTNTSFVIVLISFLWILLKMGFRNELIPLHYNTIFGVDRYGPWQYAFVYPVMVIVVTVINFLVSAFVYPRDKYLSYFLVLMSLVVSITCLVYLVSLTIYQL